MSYKMQAPELESLLKTGIPIANQIGVHNFRLSENELYLDLPLQPNTNHKGTLFGGSLYSASALACYGLFLSALRKSSVETNNIVISEGEMKYLAPVAKDATVVAFWNSVEERDQFFKTLFSKKKARVQMRAQIQVSDHVCAEFSGQFVAHL